jgi:hypothetical protein
MLEPDIDAIEIFTDALFRHAGEGFVSLRAFLEQDAAKPYMISAVSVAGNNLSLLNERAAQGARQAANHSMGVVFCPPIAIFNDRKKAAEANLVEGLALSVECDQHPQRALRRLWEVIGPPTLVVESGGLWTDPATGETHKKLHLHWRLKTPARGKQQLADLKLARDLACRLVGGDPSNKSVVHPIRWAGTWHKKAEPILCRIASANPDEEIDLGIALARLKEAMPQEQARANGHATGDGFGDASKEHHGGGGTEWDELVANILAGTDLHSSIARLAAKMIATGTAAGAAVNMLRGFMKASSAVKDDRWQARYDDIPRAVETAEQKYRRDRDGGEGATNPSAGEAKGSGAKKWAWHFWGDPDVKIERKWLVRDLLPEIGAGLMSGQWGTYKTFVALDLAASVMSGKPFIEFPIDRPGGVLFVACEGQSEIPVRVEAVVHAKMGADIEVPFAWREDCPPLLGKNAVNEIAEMMGEAAAQMLEKFGVPPVLAIFDTAGKAAGYVNAGEENDAVIARNLMKALALISAKVKVCSIGVDHFGKATETGTRGSSSKEADADFVLALLGEKDITGKVTNPRLVIRKRRSGDNGVEYPFKTDKRTLDGEGGFESSTLTIDWQQASAAGESTKTKSMWSKSIKLLRQVLNTVLIESGVEMQPFADGPVVRAVNIERVRGEFYRSYHADGDEKQKQEARRQAFHRAVKDAQAKQLVGLREIDGITYVWLVQGEAE